MMQRRVRLTAFVFVFGVVGCESVGVAAATCTPSDIEIMQTTLVRRGSRGQYPNVVGELRNNCAEAVGVELRATFRDAQGQVVSATSFWPASTSNIPGKTRWSIDHPGEGETAPTSVELRVANVRVWPPR